MPGYPAPVRAHEVPPLPGPGQWPSQRRRARRRLLWTLVSVAAVLVLSAAATLYLLLPGDGDKVAADASAASPSPTATPHPSFRSEAPPVSVLGDNWQPGDATMIQDFAEWPFAFRTPTGTTCQFWVGEPAYKANNCKWDSGSLHTVTAFVIRRCVEGCSAAERAKFETITPWKPDTALTDKDPTTRFGVVDYGDRQQFTMLHYFAVPAGGPPQWVVIAQANCPEQQRDLALKTINDVRSQTG
jgi:hypothetical protein